MIFDQSKHFEFSVGKAIKWFETHPYHHIAVFSNRKGEYYENDNPNNPAKFTSLKQNVAERSQYFNYSVGNAINLSRAQNTPANGKAFTYAEYNLAINTNNSNSHFKIILNL